MRQERSIAMLIMLIKTLIILIITTLINFSLNDCLYPSALASLYRNDGFAPKRTGDVIDLGRNQSFFYKLKPLCVSSGAPATARASGEQAQQPL